MARVGRGGLAERRNAYIWVYSPHTTQPLFLCEVLSCRQKMQQLYSTRGPFIFSGTAASLDFFSLLFDSHLWI